LYLEIAGEKKILGQPEEWLKGLATLWAEVFAQNLRKGGCER